MFYVPAHVGKFWIYERQLSRRDRASERERKAESGLWGSIVKRKVKLKRVISSGVGLQGVLNPGEELTHFDVHSRVVGLSTSLTP